jgi:hypothetical protein
MAGDTVVLREFLEFYQKRLSAAYFLLFFFGDISMKLISRCSCGSMIEATEHN